MTEKYKKLKLLSFEIMNKVFHDVVSSVEGFSGVSESDNFVKELNVDFDDYSQPFLSLVFVYLQDEENYRPTMDEEVIEQCKKTITKNGFDDVRRIVVNFTLADRNVSSVDKEWVTVSPFA